MISGMVRCRGLKDVVGEGLLFISWFCKFGGVRGGILGRFVFKGLLVFGFMFRFSLVNFVEGKIFFY